MRRYIPVLVLFCLSPLVAEVLFGATPFSRLGGLIPVAALYGGGAVLIRELARRRGTGWGRIALLGAAYAIAEEGLAIQSLFNPDLFNAGIVGGRALGVNWVWTEWTTGYHIVWSIIIPIALAEMLFPSRRSEPWLGRTGIIVMGALYLVGWLAIAVVFRLIVAPTFRAPATLLIVAALLAAVLVALALAAPFAPARPAAGRAAPPYLVGLLTLLAATGWFVLLSLPDALRDGAWAVLPILAEATMAAGAAALLQRWSSCAGWGDLHRLAAVSGALLVVMAIGFLVITAGNRFDQLGQGIASLLAIALLILFALRLHRRQVDLGTPIGDAHAGQV